MHYFATLTAAPEHMKTRGATKGRRRPSRGVAPSEATSSGPARIPGVRIAHIGGPSAAVEPIRAYWQARRAVFMHHGLGPAEHGSRLEEVLERSHICVSRWHRLRSRAESRKVLRARRQAADPAGGERRRGTRGSAGDQSSAHMCSRRFAARPYATTRRPVAPGEQRNVGGADLDRQLGTARHLRGRRRRTQRTRDATVIGDPPGSPICARSPW